MFIAWLTGHLVAQLQIPQGFSESDEEDELYEEAEDTRKQHSQFYNNGIAFIVLTSAGLKFIFTIIYNQIFAVTFPPFLECEMKHYTKFMKINDHISVIILY